MDYFVVDRSLYIFWYLILMMWRAFDLNLVMVSLLAWKYKLFKVGMDVFHPFYEMKLKTSKFKVFAFWSQQRYHDQIQITGFSYQKNQILKSWWEWQPSLPHSCILLHKQATHWPPTPNNLGPSVIISMLALFCRGLKLIIRAYWLFDPPEHFFQFSPLHFKKDRPITT